MSKIVIQCAKRSPSVPELPTIAEAALPGFAVDQWYGLLVPARDAKRSRRQALRGDCQGRRTGRHQGTIACDGARSGRHATRRVHCLSEDGNGQVGKVGSRSRNSRELVRQRELGMMGTLGGNPLSAHIRVIDPLASLAVS